MLAVVTIAGGAAYCVVMLTAGATACSRASPAASSASAGCRSTASLLVVLAVMLCGLATDAIGIHAVFGGFICGAAMPRGGLRQGAPWSAPR